MIVGFFCFIQEALKLSVYVCVCWGHFVGGEDSRCGLNCCRGENIFMAVVEMKEWITTFCIVVVVLYGVVAGKDIEHPSLVLYIS